MQTPLTGTSKPSQTVETPEVIEIDLKKYIMIVAGRWRLILTCALIGALLGGFLSYLMPSPYEATSSVAIVKTSTQVEFDPKFKTVTQDEVPQLIQSADNRRATLLGLVQNGAIATNVARELETQLTAEERNPARLLDKVKGNTSGRGDLILIGVTDQDPQKASNIANAWAREYERYVNGLYGGAPVEYSASVKAEYDRAQVEAQKAQAALETFISESQIDELERTIAEKKQVLDAIQQGRQSAVTLVISEQLKVNSAIIAAYLGAQSANRLVAFEKEQEGRRDLIKAYLDAQNAAQVSVFNEEVQSDLDALKRYYALRIRVQHMIGAARSMRDQVNAGGDTAAASNGSALSLLKTQAFALTVPVSANVEIQLQNTQALSQTATAQLMDLDALIEALEERDRALTEEIDKLSQKMMSGSGYRLQTSQVITSKVAEAISVTYPSLFEVGQVGKLSESVPATNPLTLAAQDKANEMLRFQSSSLMVDPFTDGDATISVINRLQIEIRKAQAELEKQRAAMQGLTEQRDLTRETASTLARKLAEVALTSAVTGSEVRVASPAFPPERRTLSRMTSILGGAVIGLVLGVMAAFILHAFFEDRIARITNKGAFNRAARWILAAH
jgi:capsular polysaccharide biosynthesis protein